MVSERNWFFRLSRLPGFPRAAYRGNPDFIRPESRRNEIIGLLDQGLEDVSASRARLSGACPFRGPPATGSGRRRMCGSMHSHYWTATRLPGARASWPAQLHVVGKDITRFHCVIWPAMLEAAGLPLPEASGHTASCSSVANASARAQASSSTWTRRSTASGPMPSATTCCEKFLGWRRQLQLGTLRGAVHLRAGRWAGEPRIAIARHDPQVP